MSGKRFLITGGLGFVGSSVIGKLREQLPDALIFVYDNGSSYCKKPGALDERIRLERHREVGRLADEIFHGDVLDRELVTAAFEGARPTHVLHLAGVPLAAVANDAPHLPVDVNVNGTLNVLFAAQRQRAALKRLVFVSSSFVYGHFQGNQAREDDPLVPIDLYGASKLVGEVMTRSYCERLGIEHVVIRPSAVYGPGDCNQRIVQQLIESALAGRKLNLHNGSSPLDFTYVEDLADGLVKALSAPDAAGQTFNLTAGKGRTLEDLVDAIRTQVPRVEVEYSDPGFPRPKRGTLDISQAKSLLGYQPQHDLETGVANYVSIYLEMLTALEPPTPLAGAA